LDTYRTITAPSDEVLLKEKNSKFFGYAFPVISEGEVKEYLESLRKQHVGAGHFCYAWQIGTSVISYRANDDGEPSNSAGMPIYGQIQSFKVTNILVVVVRFFGGVKLGVGGLISAYRETARMALEAADVIEKTIDVRFIVSFGYQHMNKVMRIVREKNLDVISHKMELDCEIKVAVRKQNADASYAAFSSLFGVTVLIDNG
jgi:uncharacterized YigZ family protein